MLLYVETGRPVCHGTNSSDATLYAKRQEDAEMVQEQNDHHGEVTCRALSHSELTRSVGCRRMVLNCDWATSVEKSLGVVRI